MTERPSERDALHGRGTRPPRGSAGPGPRALTPNADAAALGGCWKGRFPLRVGTTSYVLHDREDNLLRNVGFLKDRVDRVQLLFFSMEYSRDLLRPPVMKALTAMKESSGVEYSVHLPLDLDLLNPDPVVRRKSAEFTAKLVQSTACWNCEVYVLHVSAGSDFDPVPVRLCQTTREIFDRALSGLAGAIGDDRKKIFIENTHYELPFFGDLIETWGFGVCMDTGHLMRCGHDMEYFMARFGGRIGEVHLHGYDGADDHVDMRCTPPELRAAIARFLAGYAGPITIEIFDAEGVRGTLDWLEEVWR